MKFNLKEIIRKVVKESNTTKFQFGQSDETPMLGDIVIESMNGPFRVKIHPNKILAKVGTDKEAFDVARKALGTNPSANVFYMSERGNTWLADK